MKTSHVVTEPAILYFGTPVVLISTVNKDGSVNVGPMSSVFWLGWRAMLGLDASSKTTENMIRTGECVLNLPSVDGASAVNRLARTTGSDPVPSAKEMRGYRHEKDKLTIGGLSPIPSETVSPPRLLECPVQLESVVVSHRSLAEEDDVLRGMLLVFEVRIQRVHCDPSILMDGHPNRIDSDRWRPLIMCFQKLYGLADREAIDSNLGKIPESTYLSPEVERARNLPTKSRVE